MLLFLSFVGCLTSQQHASVSQAQICSNSCTRPHTEREVADPTFDPTSHSILTPGQQVSAPTRYRQGPGRVDVCLFVGCLTSQQQASVSQGRICSDNFACCHTEIEVADQTFYLTQSQYTDTGPTSPSADPITPGAWQASHWSAIFLSHWYDSTPKKSRRQLDYNNNNNNDFISIALFHVQHAQLR